MSMVITMVTKFINNDTYSIEYLCNILIRVFHTHLSVERIILEGD